MTREEKQQKEFEKTKATRLKDSEGKISMKVDIGGGEGSPNIFVDYPSNSHKSKKKAKGNPKKEVKKVTKGKVVKKKKSLSKKFAETFLDAEDIESVATYAIHDVIVPAIKNMFADTINNTMDMLLFGKIRGGRSRAKGRPYVSYGSYYSREREERSISKLSRTRHNFDEIVLEDRGEAEEVLNHLVDLIDDYGMASVADLYDLVGITSAFTDNKYGWDNLSTARILPVRGGYVISLPRTILLE
jgi:hypothetical protein